MNRPTSFQLHIRPLFRDDPDVLHMNNFGINLADYDDVKNNSSSILVRLKARNNTMMPPQSAQGPWPDEWISLFERWIQEGHPK
jgi:hypothetical protein